MKHLSGPETRVTEIQQASKIWPLGPLVWPKAPSVDFSRHFVRENKRKTKEKKNTKMQDYLIQMSRVK